MSGEEIPGVRLTRVGDVPFTGLDGNPAVQLSRVVTAVGSTELGGGFIRFEPNGELSEWTLRYDEVLLVLDGQMEVISGGRSVIAGPEECIVISKGTTVTYKGKAGTRAFFVLFPREWATRS